MVLPRAEATLFTAGAAVTLENCTPAQKGRRCCTVLRALDSWDAIAARACLLWQAAAASSCDILALVIHLNCQLSRIDEIKQVLRLGELLCIDDEILRTHRRHRQSSGTDCTHAILHVVCEE